MKKKQEETAPKWLANAQKVADKRNADVYLYSGGVGSPSHYDLAAVVEENCSRPNVVLMLTTTGGSADAAYFIARYLQRKYAEGEFILYVDSICKSAGTLIALGADEIVMSDGAELGPLDVQVSKHDEVGEFASGLTPSQAFTALRVEACNIFDEHFRRLRYRYRFPTRIAVTAAAKVAIGLLGPIYAQIDPMRLGETERSMMIAKHYGDRVSRNTDNLKDETLSRLLVRYPSHEFVIDREEASTLFSRVRAPDLEEILLVIDVAELVNKGQQNDQRDQPAVVVALSQRASGVIEEDVTTKGDSNETPQVAGVAPTAGGAGSVGPIGANGEGHTNPAGGGQPEASHNGEAKEGTAPPPEANEHPEKVGAV